MAAAGSPAGGVGTLDLSGVGEHLTAGFAGTGANFAAGDLNTLNDGNITLGQLNDGTAGASTNYAWDDIDDELANNAAIISVGFPVPRCLSVRSHNGNQTKNHLS